MVLVEFSHAMKSIDFSDSSFYIEVRSILTGLKYEFEYSANWKSKHEIEFSFEGLNIHGDKNENLTIHFNEDQFKSEIGAPLYVDSVWTHPYKTT